MFEKSIATIFLHKITIYLRNMDEASDQGKLQDVVVEKSFCQELE
jgi:hypothetical protein